jgi:hypothetical protein
LPTGQKFGPELKKGRLKIRSASQIWSQFQTTFALGIGFFYFSPIKALKGKITYFDTDIASKSLLFLLNSILFLSNVKFLCFSNPPGRKFLNMELATLDDNNRKQEQ